MKKAFVNRNHNGTYLEHHESYDEASKRATFYMVETGNIAFTELEEFEDKPVVHLY